MTDAIIQVQPRELDAPVMSIAQAVERYNALTQFVKTILRKDIDYGKIPGAGDKPTLLKPGAEKLSTFFGLTKRFQLTTQIEDWDGSQPGHNGEPLFYYVYRASMYRGDLLIAEADGSANSRESKHRWRWVQEADIPPHLNKDTLAKRASSISEMVFALNKRETTGKYGKPAAYWERFDKAIADGTARRVQRKLKDGREMDAWEIASVVYRVPNDDVASLVNTLQKMAQKRALVAACLLAVNASDFFAEDMEDMDLIDVPATAVVEAPAELPEVADVRQDVHAALRDYAKEHGHAEAMERMRQVTGATRVSEIPADKLPTMLEALAGKAGAQ